MQHGARPQRTRTDWPAFTITSDRFEEGFKFYLYPRREIRNLRACRSSRSQNVFAGSGGAWRSKDGKVLERTSVLQWLPLAELRERFIKKHGPQEWQLADVTEWTLDQVEELYTSGLMGNPFKIPAWRLTCLA